jgi:3-hydroxyisobutyrate dehydrogenase-like beta-hydroxyacid dehydrogenase
MGQLDSTASGFHVGFMKISVLGLGIIGGAWAKNLIADGHEVRCWNRTPKEFPNFHSSIEEAVEGAEAIFIVVADPPAVQSVLDQIKPQLSAGKTVIQSSTISAKWTLEFANQVRESDAEFLEAPFTGSKLAAEQRKTVYYLGGDAALVEKMRPLLKSLAGEILHIGPLGSASTLKLAMNMNIAGQAQILCESLTLARAAGIADETFFSALHVNASRSGLSDLKEPKLRAHDYSAQFSVKHMLKDLRLALETAGDFSLPLAQTESVKKVYESAAAAGWSNDDFISLVRAVEKS